MNLSSLSLLSERYTHHTRPTLARANKEEINCGLLIPASEVDFLSIRSCSTHNLFTLYHCHKFVSE
jgi:hypothetical protein